MSRAQSLFWLVHEMDGGARVVRIQEADALIFARMRASLDGFGGTYVESHLLDGKLAKKIPKAMIGRALTADEAAALLDKLA